MKNIIFNAPGVIVLCLSVFLIHSCKKDETTLPGITTTAISEISYTTAISGGIVTSEGGTTVVSRGVCWKTSVNPTISDNKTNDGGGPGAFTSNISQLTPGTQYYVRSYATNSTGTNYGNEVSFNTSQIAIPLLTTTELSGITITTAFNGGNITSDGGAPVTDRGVCWSTNINPTTADPKTSNGTGTGIFTSDITGLSGNTVYYVRAYATNNSGTAYGSQISFKTMTSSVTDIDGNVYYSVTIGIQEWMSENLKVTRYRNGDQIPNVPDYIEWGLLTTGGRCENTYVTNFTEIYGWFYNWYAVADSRNICPTGWHVPTDAEWTTLTTFLGGEDIAGGKLKETGTTHWETPNTGATNESGFTALPAEGRAAFPGFAMPGDNGQWWTATEFDASNAWNRIMSNLSASINSVDNTKEIGFSIRCIKDN